MTAGRDLGKAVSAGDVRKSRSPCKKALVLPLSILIPFKIICYRASFYRRSCLLSEDKIPDKAVPYCIAAGKAPAGILFFVSAKLCSVNNGIFIFPVIYIFT